MPPTQNKCHPIHRRLGAALLAFSLLLATAFLVPGCRSVPDITGTSAAAPSQEYEQYTETSVKERDRFDQFTDRLFRETVASSQLSLHFTLADPERYGITEAQSPFGEVSLEALKEDMADTKQVYEELHGFDTSALSDQQKLTWSVLNSYLETALMSDSLELYSRPLAPTIGVQAQLPLLLAEYTFYDRDDVTDYLSLLSQIDTYFGELGAFEKQKAESGLGYSDGTLDRIIDSCKTYLVVPQENFLTETFDERLETLTGVTEEEKEEWRNEHVTLIAEHFLPAYQSLIETLTSLKGMGTNEMGMCGYPDGEAYYEYLVYAATGTSYPSVDALTDAVTYQIEEDAAAVAELLNPQLYEEMLTASFRETEADTMIEDLKTQIEADFPQLPDCTCTVKDVPQSLELALSPALYLTPPIDRYEDNVIYINRNERYDSTPIYTTLAHEGYPGHLYQTVYFTASCGEPLRHALSFPAYTEGWATYAEFQSYFFDNGLSPDLQKLQMHNQAVTLGIHAILDLNINYYGWTRDQTAAFLEETYGITDRDTVDRMYDVMIDNPSNYLEYYVGWLEFKNLRQEAEETLGTSFDAKSFHTLLLETGPAPFPILQSYMKAWMATSSLSQAAS